MEKYTWSYKTEDMTINLTLEIGEYRYRFENEGILQDVALSLNDKVLYYSSFGREHVLMEFHVFGFNDIKDILLSYKLSNETIKFCIDWLILSLTPITTQRNIKINLIKNKLLSKNEN